MQGRVAGGLALRYHRDGIDWVQRRSVTMKKIALIGYGAIAGIVTDKLREHDPDGKVRLVGILVRESRVADVQKNVGDKVRVVSTIDDLIHLTPNMVVECAGQGAWRIMAKRCCAPVSISW